MLKTLTFIVSAENHPDLLARAVMLFHRMAIPIYGLSLERPMDGSNLRMMITIVADSEKSERIAVNLGKIVHVLSVETRKQRVKPSASALAELP